MFAPYYCLEALRYGFINRLSKCGKRVAYLIHLALLRSITSNLKGKKFVIFQTAFPFALPCYIQLHTAKIAVQVQFIFEVDEQTYYL